MTTGLSPAACADHTAIASFDWMAHHSQRAPAQLAVHELGTGRRYTYQDLDRRAGSLAGWLRPQGLSRGDRVALLAPNGVHNFEL
jgi:fatty-acyl-CoA synthase